MPHPIPNGTVIHARSLDLDEQTRVHRRLSLESDPDTIVLRRPERWATGSSPQLDVRTKPAPPPEARTQPAPPPEVRTKPARELAPPPPEVFALIRRIALQRDLPNAGGVLHAGLGDLVAAQVVLAQIVEGGKLTSPVIADLREAAKHVPFAGIFETHKRRQRFVAERLVMVPLGTASPTVLVVWRTPRQPAFDELALRLLGQACARLGVLDHFLVLANQHAVQAAADQDSVFRAEALAAARGDKRECELVDLSPRTLRASIPLLVLTAGVLVALAALVQVPTYSRGAGVVTLQGVNVISNTTGAVTTKFVEPGQQIAAGDPLVALDTTQERQAYEQINAVYRDQLSNFLFDLTDESAAQSLGTIIAQRKTAIEAVNAKTILAPVDGTIGEWLAPDLVQAGEQVVTVLTADASPKVIAYVPGIDLKRIQPGMMMQIEVIGHPDSRRTAVITAVGSEPVSASQARKTFGQKLGESVSLPQSGVRVEAALPADGFASGNKTYQYSDGLEVLVEIKVDTKSFLSVVIPTGD
ncbi:MAG TPA: HlyD family efflux transporter periplasmic adaptor subunit [Kofleriaceae bacterium]